MATDVTTLSAKEIEKAHKYADTDSKPTAIHHTIGPGPMQAASGTHAHDGGTSSKLTILEGFVLTDLASVIVALKSIGAS